MTTVLITGVAGFIGSNLAEALLERGYKVIGLDNLSQGFSRNIADFQSHLGFKFYRDDVCNPLIVDELVGQADCVVHLAAFKIPRYGNSMDTLMINTHGTHNILHAAAKRGCRVILASTSDVYGRNPEVPFHEGSDLWMGPSSVKRWAYAISKMYEQEGW